MKQRLPTAHRTTGSALAVWVFMGLKAPLKAGDSFPLKLKFEEAGEVTVEVKVEAPGKDAAPKDTKH